MSDLDYHIGRRLRDRRIALGLSQALLGARAGITCQRIASYEDGEITIGAGTMYCLARALDVSIPYFFEGLAPDAPPLRSLKPVPGAGKG